MAEPLAPIAPAHPASGYAAVADGLTREIAALSSEPASVATERVEPEVRVAAHRAVEFVLHTVEQSRDRERSSVSLRFSVGDAELNVRVELRDDEVRTTFRTDSTELRQALADEWQSVAAAAASGDRAVRFAPAVFTSTQPESASSHGSFADTGGGERGAFPQNGRGAHQDTPMPFTRSIRPAATPTVSGPAEVSPVRRANSRHLHARA